MTSISILLATVGLALCTVSLRFYTGDENPETQTGRLGLSNALLSVGIALIIVAGIIAYTK